MDNRQSPFEEITFRFPPISTKYAYRDLAIECYKQRRSTTEITYVLPFIFLHMYLESLLFINFETILFASRAGISKEYSYNNQDLIKLSNISQTGNIEKRIKYLEKIIILKNIDKNNVILLDEEDKIYMTSSAT